MFLSPLFLIHFFYFPLSCLNLKRNNEAHNPAFTGNNSDLLPGSSTQHTEENVTGSKLRILEILGSHHLSDQGEHRTGKVTLYPTPPTNQWARKNMVYFLMEG